MNLSNLTDEQKYKVFTTELVKCATSQTQMKFDGQWADAGEVMLILDAMLDNEYERGKQDGRK